MDDTLREPAYFTLEKPYTLRNVNFEIDCAACVMPPEISE